MILEGIVTSLDENDELNVAPMGPIVDEAFTTLVLRPFHTSRTYHNLKARPYGVLHVVDDVLLLAQAAIGLLPAMPATFPAERVAGQVLSSACRWYEFEIEACDDSCERTEMRARIVHSGRLRDSFGFNRAKHAVLEGAILATRLHLLPPEKILDEFDRLRIIVDKTAGPHEREAFDLLQQYVRQPDRRFSISGTGSPRQAKVLEENIPRRSDIPVFQQPAGRSESNDAHSREVVVTTGARLHFGFFAHGQAQRRQFGGVGVMVDQPGFVVHARRTLADELACGVWIDRVAALLSRLRSLNPDRITRQPLRIEIQKAPAAHAGLGSGTQLGMAVAKAVSLLSEEQNLPAAELASRAGRGARSALGLYGFQYGGLLVEGGKLAPQAISPLVARVEFPAEWRFVLVRPRGAAGISGSEELNGFSQLAPMPVSLSDRLCRIALTEILPAVVEHDFSQTSDAIGRFGRLVGEYFAPAQGGVFADDRMHRLAQTLAARDIRGVGQTSWGPTLFILCPSAAFAQDLTADLMSDLAAKITGTDCEFTIAAPLNRGATIACRQTVSA